MTSDNAAGDANHQFSFALLSHLAALGVEHVCLSPGSRSTPLALAAAVLSDTRLHVLHDERVSGFYGLGIAKATGTPVVLICTSGTAAVELSPAVTEAFQSHAPLIVLTSDRPPELQGVGAPQTINQHQLYATHTKWSHHETPPSEETIESAASLAGRAVLAAMSSPRGPVHLNLPFREPLTPSAEFSYPTIPPTPPVVAAKRHPTPADLSNIGDRLIGRKTIFIVGHTTSDPTPIGQLAVDIGAVLFADVTSALRTDTATSTLVAPADALAAAGALDLDPPEVVVRWGGLPTSKPVWAWLDANAGVDQIVVDDGGRTGPAQTGRSLVNADPGATAQTLVGEGIVCDKPFIERWLERSGLAKEAIEAAITYEAFPNEPAVAKLVSGAVAAGARVFAGSSMPIRDLDLVCVAPQTTAATLANRGANGIDGSIATALGAAVAGPVVAMIGDVAALYDLGGIAAAARSDLDLTIVVIHNDGGGIFSFLAQAEADRVEPDVFERLFGAPHGTDFVEVATALGMRAAEVDSAADMRHALSHPGPQLLQIHTDRTENVAVHSRIHAAVAVALRA